MITQEQLEKVRRWTTEFWDKLDPLAKLYKPTVQWDLKGRCAGKAWATFVKINPEVWKHGDLEIYKTLGHELAHSVCSQMYRNKGIRIKSHGHEWKSAMAVIGLESNRCHSMPLTPAKNRERVSYACDCGREHDVTVRVHQKIQRGSIYRCTHCKSVLRRSDNPIQAIAASAPAPTEKEKPYPNLVGTELMVYNMMMDGRTDAEMIIFLRQTKWTFQQAWWCEQRLKAYKQVVIRKTLKPERR
jgi:SprT protein